MNKNNLISSDYKTFLIQIKKEILESRNNILKTINKELVNLYFNLWKNISEKIENDWWWKNIVEKLSEDLKKEFPWIQWFSKDNLWRMVKLYTFYSKNSKLAPLVQEISWSNNIIILEKCENNYQIEYYLKLAKKHI